jgi:predicted nucleotidyltransferase/plasmid maintenance system antidote protein VapI
MMLSVGRTIRKLRVDKGDPIRKVAAYLDIDQAILSKIERGQRKAKREQIIKLAEYFEVDEKQLIASWLKDKIIEMVQNEYTAEKALQLAEKQITYIRRKEKSYNDSVEILSKCLKDDGRIKSAWIFGSFARGDDHQESDIDLLVEEIPDVKFNYFDLADLKHKLEKKLNRKVDLGFASSVKKKVSENILNDIKLVYERVEPKK